MVKRGKQSEYQIWIEPDFNSAREELPGNIRQRVKRILNSLGADPRPNASKVLDIAELELPFAIEIRRLRLEHWRILYAVNDREGWVWVLGIHKRPPYQYEDLQELISKLR